MIRVESLISLGFFLGGPIWIGAVLLVQKYLRRRDSQIVKTRVAESIREADTDQLLDELSSRNDLTQSGKKGL